MKTQNFVLADANASWAQEGPWSVLFYEAGNAGGATATIRVRSLSGNGEVDVELKPGRQIRLGKPATGIVITSLAGTGVVGKISLGTGDIQDSSVMGEVSVVDGGKARSMAGVAYSGVALCALVATLTPRVQLWNPTAGKRLVVSQVLVGSSFTQTAYLKRVTSALASAGSGPEAKMMGLPSSTADMRSQAVSTANAAPYLGILSVNAANVTAYKLAEPIVIPTGYGLNVQGSAADADLYATFEFTEESA